MIRRVHVIKSARVEDVVAQKLIGRAVKIVRARSRRYIDLAAARTSPFRQCNFQSQPEIPAQCPATG